MRSILFTVATILGGLASAACCWVNALSLDEPRHQARARENLRRPSRQRLRLHGQEYFARTQLVGRAERRQELCDHRLRSRRADGQRFLALGRRQHSRRCDVGSKRGRRSQGRGAASWRADELERILARPAMAALARRRATNRIIISSTYSPSMSTSWTSMKTRRPRSSASIFISTLWRKQR